MDGIRIAPFCTWLMLGFYESIPYTLEEAAMLDGCSRLRALWHVVFPLVSPGIAAVAIFQKHFVSGLTRGAIKE